LNPAAHPACDGAGPATTDLPIASEIDGHAVPEAGPTGADRQVVNTMRFKSKAQRRKFAELLLKGEITPEAYEEWNRDTGRAQLPERVTPAKRRKKRKAKPKARTKPRRETPQKARKRSQTKARAKARAKPKSKRRS
jgi:hypothetical protein